MPVALADDDISEIFNVQGRAAGALRSRLIPLSSESNTIVEEICEGRFSDLFRSQMGASKGAVHSI